MLFHRSCHPLPPRVPFAWSLPAVRLARLGGALLAALSGEWSDTLATGSWSGAGVTEQFLGDNGVMP